MSDDVRPPHMRLTGIDHVEFYVADADHTAAGLCADYGFRVAGHVTAPDCRSTLLRQGDIQLLVTQALADDHPATAFVASHGDGPATIALATDDPDAALAEVVAAGAVPLLTEARPGNRTRFTAFGDVAHTFVAPGELAARCTAVDDNTESLALLDVLDHVAVCVPHGELAATVAFYQRVLGFHLIFEEYIEVGEQGMNSQVVQGPSAGVTLTLLEPDTTKAPGQIDDFVRAHDGAGVQHLALRTGDIATSVRTLGERGVKFLTTPGSYFDELERRLGHVGLPVDTLRELNILVDQDNEGELFQIFARSTHPRHTFFFEIIERRDAWTFGTANIKALYEAVERERARQNAVAR